MPTAFDQALNCGLEIGHGQTYVDQYVNDHLDTLSVLGLVIFKGRKSRGIWQIGSRQYVGAKVSGRSQACSPKNGRNGALATFFGGKCQVGVMPAAIGAGRLGRGRGRNK